MRNRAKPQFPVAECPTCGAKQIRWVCEPCVFEVGRRRVTSPPVPHWHCLHCGERLFDAVSERVLAPWREQVREVPIRSGIRRRGDCKTIEAGSRR